MTTGYRSKNSYRSSDPTKRARSLENLNRQGRARGVKAAAEPTKDLQEIDIITFATDQRYLGLSFQERPAQEVLLRVLYGLPLDRKQIRIYKKLTGNKKEFESGQEKTEAVWVLGARSGKSLLASIITLFEATRNKWQEYLSPGEFGYIVVIATRQKQAEQIIQANCSRLIENSPALRGLVKDLYQTELTLNNGMKIISLPATSTAGRGIPLCAFILDEVGHFYTEGIKADQTIYDSLRPRMAQFPGAKVVLISTPSAKMGLLWNFFNEGFTVPSRWTAQAETRIINPVIPKEFIKREYRRDIDYAQREFGAEFAEKIESFFAYEVLENSFTLVGSLPYKSEFDYSLGIDQSGLSGRDRFALAISHREEEKILVDHVEAWETKDSDVILKGVGELAEAYSINKVSIDRYSRGWVTQALNKLGLEVEIRPSLPEIYTNLKSLLIALKVRLPDVPDLRKALQNTQAYFGKNNSLSIGHQRSAAGHADLADAVASSVWVVSSEDTSSPSWFIIDTNAPVVTKKKPEKKAEKKKKKIEVVEKVESAAERNKRIWNTPGAWTRG